MATLFLIPTMTSDTLPSGVVSASSCYPTVAPWWAFNGVAPGWVTYATGADWIQYQFPTAQTVTAYSLIPWNADSWPQRALSAWTLAGSNDGTTWTVLDTQSAYPIASWAIPAPNVFTLARAVYYKYFRLTITANNGNSFNALQQLQLLKSYDLSPVIIITTSPLPSGMNGGVYYTTTLAAQDGSGIYTWSITSGTLPAGLALNSNTGVISGIPTTTGTYNFTVQVNDGTATANSALSLTTIAAPTQIVLLTTASPLYPTTVGHISTNTFAATYGTGIYTWSVSSGTLPIGLLLDASTGILSGTCTTAGTYNFTVQVVDTNSSVASSPFVMTIYSSFRLIPCAFDPTNPLATNCKCLLTFTEQPQWTAVCNLVDQTWFPVAGMTPTWNADSMNFIAGLSWYQYIDTQKQLPAFEQAPMDSMPFTMVFKVNLNALTANSVLATRNLGGNGYSFYITSTGQVVFYWSRSSTNLTVGGGSITPGQWQQIAVVYNGSQTASGFKIYINGELVTLTTNTSGSGTFAYPASTCIRFGGGSDSSAVTLNGKMAYVALYANRQLSAEELGQLDSFLPVQAADTQAVYSGKGWVSTYGWLVTADSEYNNYINGDYWPMHVVDDIWTTLSTIQTYNAENSWVSANTAGDHWLVIDMLTPQSFNVFSFWRRNDVGGAIEGMPNQFDLYVSSDGVTWGTSIYTNNAVIWGASSQCSFPTQTTRYLKFVSRKNFDGGGNPNANNYTIISKVRVGNRTFQTFDNPTVDFASITMLRDPQVLPTFVPSTTSISMFGGALNMGYVGQIQGDAHQDIKFTSIFPTNNGLQRIFKGPIVTGPAPSGTGGTNTSGIGQIYPTGYQDWVVTGSGDTYTINGN